MHAHTCVHACTAYANIHFRPDMKIIKIKASDLYKKKQQQKLYTCEQKESLGYLLPKSYLNLHTFIHMHY